VKKPRLRVLVNAVHAKSGGGITYLRNLLPRLSAEADIDLHLLLSPAQVEAFSDLEGSVNLRVVDAPRSWWALILWEQLVLPFSAHRRGSDVMFSPANYGPLLIRAQVVALQSAPTVGRVERRLRRRIYWRVLGVVTILSQIAARRTIAVSRYVAQLSRRGAIGRWLPDPRLIHHGVGAAFSPAPTGGGREGFLLVVSDVYVQKNIHGLVVALAALRTEGRILHLKVAGSVDVDPVYMAELRKVIRAQDAGDLLEFLGRQSTEALVALYRRCALFVFPSTEESFGMPLVEAMACGAPIAASKTAATPEIAADAALLFDPHDPKDMAEKIARALDDAVLREDLAAKGLKRAREFCWDKAARETACVLREAAGWISKPCAE
jgi:glycosyltransferase involved in cell wall biosynthesis